MLVESPRRAGEHEPIKEPISPKPVEVPPIIERPSKTDPNEPSEPPLQDPSPQLPNRSHPRDYLDIAKGVLNNFELPYLSIASGCCPDVATKRDASGRNIGRHF
jgi:hypothetical protein